MSLLGNYAFGHNDRTENVAGIGSTVPRRPSYQEGESGLPRMQHRHSTSQGRSLRRASITSVDEEKPALTDMDDEKPLPSSSGDLEKKGLDEDDSDNERNEEVRGLARQITSRSSVSNAGGENPFNAERDSRLDPASSHFNARAWAKAMLRLSERDPENFKKRTAGFAFRDLNAWGYGAATDYQKSVGNVWFGVLGSVRNIFKTNKRRIDILQSFDGLVESGEMLVVLGPPGSGCSTFLKTVAGETHGYVVDPNSYLNYQGT
jgi:ATP-binding cassette, subfamily G (WHITE), member 2, PDR